MTSASQLPHGPIWAARDSWNEATRHLRAVPRNVELLMFSTIQPVMFVVLFVYVFGGAIDAPGYSNYKQFLLPGIFAQSVVFGSGFTGVGIADDLQKGFIDRLRSLPITQAAVLIGRTVSDLCRNVLTFVVMFVVAHIIGFRIEGSVLEAALATVLLLGFSYALSWVQAWIGLRAGSVEAVNSAGFIWMFPLTFISSAFVPTESMTPWLRNIADNNPFTVATNAGRALYSGRDSGDTVWQTALWIVGITAVFAALSIRTFRKSASR